MNDYHPDQEMPPAARKNAGELIFDEAKGAHETAKRLVPLLSLLEAGQGSGALDSVLKLLTTIVEIQGQHSAALSELKSMITRPPESAEPLPLYS